MAKTFRLQHVSGVIAGPIDTKGNVIYSEDEVKRINEEFNRRRINYMRNEAAKYTDDPTELDGVGHMVGVSPSHMAVLFDLAEAECGSMRAFVQKRFALTDDEIARLRDKYLE